jgi:hypothetical protein
MMTKNKKSHPNDRMACGPKYSFFEPLKRGYIGIDAVYE